MKNIFLLVQKDFKRKWKNPAVIIGFILIPLIFTFIFGAVFGREAEQTLPQIPVLAADKDSSLLSEFFLSTLAQGELRKILNLKKVSEDQGRKLLNKGKASALIIIPEGFGSHVWEGQPTEILILKNPSEQFLPQIVEEVADVSTLLLSSLFEVFSPELKRIKNLVEEEKVSDEDISFISIQIKNRIAGISKYVLPPVIGLKQTTIQEKAGKEEKPFSVHSYMLPAISILFLLFICNTVFEDILREKEKGTLLRLTVSPLKISEYIWSKIVISVLIGILCTLLLVGVGQILFAIPWGNPILILLVILSLNVLIAGFISIFYSFIRTERQAGAVLSSVILVMSLLGGSMIPVDTFPKLFLNFSKLTVNYWGIEAFHKVMSKASLQEIMPIIIGMVLAGLVFSCIGSFFLRNNLRKGLLK